MLVTPNLKLWLPMEGNANDASAYTISGLVSHWKMNDDAANSTVVDAYGSYDGTYKDSSGAINTSTGSVAGKINNALSFDGTDEYVDTNNNFDFLKTDSFSVSFWVNFADHSEEATAAAGLVGKGHWYSSNWDVFLRNSHAISFEVDKVTIKTSPLAINTWHFITCTYNGNDGKMKIYHNGDFIADKTYTGENDFNNANNVWFGQRNGDSSRVLNGKIDDVRIYNRALNQREISRLYNKGEGTEDITDNDGEVTGASLTTGKFGKCYSFDGSDDYINVPDNSALDFNAGDDFTISVWVKTTDSGEFVINKRGENSDIGALDDYGYALYVLGDNAHIMMDDGTYYGATSTSVVNDDSWHHWAGIRRGTDIEIWVDGAKEDTTSIGSSKTIANNNSLKLGVDRDENDNWMNGLIDEPMIFDKALSQSDIKRVMCGLHPISG